MRISVVVCDMPCRHVSAGVTYHTPIHVISVSTGHTQPHNKGPPQEPITPNKYLMARSNVTCQGSLYYYNSRRLPPLAPALTLEAAARARLWQADCT